MNYLGFPGLTSVFILPAAFALDALLGDPRRLPHPVRWMGRAIQYAEPVFRKHIPGERTAGFFFAIAMIGLSWAVSLLVLGAAYEFHFIAGVFLETIMVFYCLSVRSLYEAAMQIYHLLVEKQVGQARQKLGYIVGRDVDTYETDDVARAVVETVAENYVDGVLSPLFYAALGGAPLALAFKMVNTLDSMVGYKNPRYRRFGCAAARIDDVANYLPARLSVVIIALSARLLAGRRTAGRALRTALGEGSHHSSPNAGYPEAAFAGALKVRMGGPNIYGGVRVLKPFIGSRFAVARPAHIQMACGMMLVSSWIGLIAGCCLQIFLKWV